ncbi:hypothetical protein BREVNS_1562 [Brevinematales bacterium NS]|nr:hypothetical protein BREVNS_1562 [Brevinematales bacterium NS]
MPVLSPPLFFLYPTGPLLRSYTPGLVAGKSFRSEGTYQLKVEGL